MKQMVRAFSLGIMVSTLLFAGVYFFSPDVNKPVAANSDPVSESEMVAKLKKAGYTISTETTEEKNNNNKEKKQKQDKKQQPAQSKEPEETNKLTLVVDAGTSSSSLVEKLTHAEIVEDQQAFTNYLNNNGYSTRIQIGKFTVRKGMSYKEIAETLTGK